MEDEPLDQLRDELLNEPLYELLYALEEIPHKFAVGQPVIDTVNKRKGAVVAFGFWVEREGYLVWEYRCKYEWYTRDDINADNVHWSRLRMPQHADAGEDELRKVEDFKLLEDVIHPRLGLMGTVQGVGWKQVAEVYVYQCLWRWRLETHDPLALDTTWTLLPMPTLGYPEEHELQKNLLSEAPMTYC